MYPTHHSRHQAGFTLVEIMIVVAIIGIILAIALPAFIHSRQEAQAKSCREAQLQTSGAVMRYALEYSTTTVADWSTIVGPTRYLQRTPRCPTTGQPITLPSEVDALASCPTLIPSHNPTN